MKPLDRNRPNLARWIGEFVNAPDVRTWSPSERETLTEDLRWLARNHGDRWGPGIRMWRRRMGPLTIRQLSTIQRAVRVGWSKLMDSGRLRHPLQAFVKRNVGWQLPAMRARLAWSVEGPLLVIYDPLNEPDDIVAAIGQVIVSLKPRVCACGCGDIAAVGSKYARKQCGQNARFRRHYARRRAAT